MKPTFGVWKLSRRKDVPPGTEAVLDARRREERAGTGAAPGVVEEELDLALEHVEGVGVVGVSVRIDALEIRPVQELERLDLRQLGEDSVPRCPTRSPSRCVTKNVSST